MIQHVTLLAAAKAGLKVVDIDTTIKSVSQFREALRIAKCTALIFPIKMESDNRVHDNRLFLRQVIPELLSCEPYL
jgi:hypothetical protein